MLLRGAPLIRWASKHSHTFQKWRLLTVLVKCVCGALSQDSDRLNFSTGKIEANNADAQSIQREIGNWSVLLKDKLEKLVKENTITDRLAQLVIDNLKRLESIASEVQGLAVETPKECSLCSCVQFLFKAPNTDSIAEKLKKHLEEVQKVTFSLNDTFSVPIRESFMRRC
jgi:hypothetical protein